MGVLKRGFCGKSICLNKTVTWESRLDNTSNQFWWKISSGQKDECQCLCLVCQSDLYFWVWPRNSDHQEYSMFSRESRHKPPFTTIRSWEGGAETQSLSKKRWRKLKTCVCNSHIDDIHKITSDVLFRTSEGTNSKSSFDGFTLKNVQERQHKSDIWHEAGFWEDFSPPLTWRFSVGFPKPQKKWLIKWGVPKFPQGVTPKMCLLESFRMGFARYLSFGKVHRSPNGKVLELFPASVSSLSDLWGICRLFRGFPSDSVVVYCIWRSCCEN